MRARKRGRIFWGFFSILGFALISSPSANGQGARFEGSTITGTAVAVSGRLAGRSTSFKLIINRQTTRQEVELLNEALQSGGQDRLLSVLSGMDAGRIALGSGVGVAAHAIIVGPQGNGESKMTVLYERNIGFSELRYGTRSTEYRFGYAELFLKRNGSGEGMLIPAARIRLRDGDTWEVEDFGSFPVRLMGLRVRGVRRPR